MVRKDKTEFVGFRTTPAEREEIKKNAAIAGLSISAFLIGLASGGKIADEILKSLKNGGKK